MSQMPTELSTRGAQEASEGARRPWWTLLRRIAGPAIRLLIVAAVIEFALLPQIAGARKSASLLGDVSPLWIAIAALAQVLSLLAYARLSQVSLDSRDISYNQLLRIDLATLAVSHVVPAGSAVGIGLGYRLLTRSGVPPERAVTGKALQTVGSAVVLNLILGGALIAALIIHGNNPLYGPVAAVGLTLIFVATAGGVLIAHSENRLTRMVVKLLDRVPRIDAEAGRRLVSTLAGTIRRLVADRKFLARLILWALLNWMLEAAALWACVRAFGHTLGPIGLLVAYGLANVAAALPITPGGIGIVEGILVPALVAFDTPRGVAVLGVLAFRLLSFWLPIPIGFASYARLEWQLRHRPDDETAEQPEDRPVEAPDAVPGAVTGAVVGEVAEAATGRTADTSAGGENAG